jgi:hypothetical protein
MMLFIQSDKMQLYRRVHAGNIRTKVTISREVHMTKRRKISFTSLFNQKGFGHVELFAAIVFVIIIGFIGDRVYEASHAATPSSTLFGVAASASTLSQYESEFGHLPVIRYYYTGLPASNAWTTGVPGLSKSAVIVSFKALPKTILSGADDATLTHFFDTAPTGHPIYYSYFHEPEDNIAHGQFTLADYKAAWTHIVTGRIIWLPMVSLALLVGMPIPKE